MCFVCQVHKLQMKTAQEDEPSEELKALKQHEYMGTYRDSDNPAWNREGIKLREKC